MNILKGFLILGAILFMIGAVDNAEGKMVEFIKCITGMTICTTLTIMINFIMNM